MNLMLPVVLSEHLRKSFIHACLHFFFFTMEGNSFMFREKLNHFYFIDKIIL